jgi:hypothetical protein
MLVVGEIPQVLDQLGRRLFGQYDLIDQAYRGCL